MDEARAVLGRLERIESLDRDTTPPERLLDELRQLVVEAERWARRERDEPAAEAVERCRDTLELNSGFTLLG